MQAGEAAMTTMWWLFVIWCALGAGAIVGFFVRDVMTMID
jgi:hypothetical protein